MRYNIFYQIHKGLRVMLYETATDLQRTDFNNEEEAESVLKAITAVTDMFDLHAQTEDTIIFPAVAEYEPSVVDAFENEHVTDHELSEKLRALINMYYSIQTDEEKIQLGSVMRRTFVEFLVFNLSHMAKEEDIINNLLWRYYTDEQIISLQQKIAVGLSPEVTATSCKWILKGLSNHEIVGWLKQVEKTAPEPVFNGLFSLAEKELPHQRFQQIVEGLTEGVMLA